MKIQNPHDKFFKETFGKVEVAKDFLNNYLPDSIINLNYSQQLNNMQSIAHIY